MGKRTRLMSDYDRIAKKIKKIEKSVRRARRKESSRSSSSSASDSGSSSSSSSCDRSPRRRRSPSPRPSDSLQQEQLSIEDVPIQYEQMPSTSAASAPPPPPPSHNTVHSPPAHDTGSTQLPSQVAGVAPPDAPVDTGIATQLDNELLKILGDDPSQPVLYGKDIQTDLSVRLQYIATTGLIKETRKKLLERYLVPGNCTLIGAPVFNLEVKAAISEAVLRKYKAIEIKQQQLASATSCVAEALTSLMSDEIKNTTIIQLLMDACKILCDSQNADSNTRRYFVQLNIKKELKEQLLASKIDKFLYSKELAETLKAAKAISKSGADLKIPSANQPANFM